ncbi:DUF2946 domain-containing protein [Erwiniaceae bacterium BAC15a-03b]|uniref:DUF2946 domain-containing protein n=1 Tax=Winslowiella arboricola TaxID=2978220 RepID=A0A9J6PUV4_9GAMM|nr:DUF2946 domain-containing protein [Winslowiella arboricola]MCU5775328.1 DUF2946 domain-containing protein [Winslowiella arboricola]MCU5780275.1 DUF2946 domain-containing protein [Winslowiella arboricola]
MVTLFRLSQRRIPALIAILTILMLFIAPEISKALEYRHMPEMATGGMAMDNMLTNHTPMQTAPLSAHHSSAAEPAPIVSSDSGLIDYFACGYCQLLVHFPLLLWVFVALIWLILLVSPSSPWHKISFYPVTLFPGIAQPRAPPAFSPSFK